MGVFGLLSLFYITNRSRLERFILSFAVILFYIKIFKIHIDPYLFCRTKEREWIGKA
jgi:hypothetical protein